MTPVTPEYVEMIQKKKAQVIFDQIRKLFVTGEEEFSIDKVIELSEKMTEDMEIVNLVIEKFGDKKPEKETHVLVGKSIAVKAKGKIKKRSNKSE